RRLIARPLPGLGVNTAAMCATHRDYLAPLSCCRLISGGTMNVFRCIATLAAVAALSAVGSAQVDSGRIAGNVRDSSGALASGANVKVKNERTGDERTAVTNERGYFLVAPLKPST